MALAITLLAQADYISIAVLAPTSGVIEIWRQTPSENDGAPMVIVNEITPNATDPVVFFDSNIASGVSYIYFADDVGGAGASPTASASIALSNAYLHSVARNILGAEISVLRITEDADGEQERITEDGEQRIVDSDPYYTNGQYSIGIIDQSHARQFAFASALRLPVNSLLPILNLSEIEDGEIGISAVIPYGDLSNLASLRSIVESRTTVCLRTALGDKWFGRIVSPREVPSGPNFIYSFQFEILDYDESVV